MKGTEKRTNGTVNEYPMNATLDNQANVGKIVHNYTISLFIYLCCRRNER